MIDTFPIRLADDYAIANSSAIQKYPWFFTMEMHDHSDDEIEQAAREQEFEREQLRIAFDALPIENASVDYNDIMGAYMVRAKGKNVAISFEEIRYSIPRIGLMIASSFARAGVRTDPDQIQRVLETVVNSGH